MAAARDRIDEWVARRPPPAYFPRRYSIPRNAADVPEPMKRLLAPIAPLLERTGQRDFAVAFPDDGRRLDAACFTDRATELLFKPTETLFPLAEAKIPPNQTCELLTSLAYGMLQTLLWREQIAAGPDPGPAPWLRAGAYADRAKGALGRSGKAQHDWIDTVIRIEAVLARATLLSGRTDEAIGHFLYLAGWYAAAVRLGYGEVVRKRYDDWLQALYAIVDVGRGPSHQAWISTAGTLLKDLRIAWRQADPFRIEQVPRAPNGSQLDLHLQAAFVDEEWRRGLDRLGDTGVFVDVIVTDRFIHTRLVGRRGIQSFRSELPQVDRPAPPGEDVRGTRPVTPTSCVLEPSVSGPGATGGRFRLARLADEWHPTLPSSELLRWSSWFQQVHVYRGDDGWRWDFEWNANVPTFEGELSRVVYGAVFAGAVDAAASASIRHLVISPDGSLMAMPHHLLPGPDGERLGDRFLVSYTPNLTGLLTILDADKFSREGARAVVVEDPTGTVSLAGWECERVARGIGRAAQVVSGAAASPASVKGLCSGASILHFSGHATFDWSKPEDAFLLLAGDGRLTLADLRGLGLKPGALVFLSACDTGRRTISGTRGSARGIVSALLEAGAATVVCTLWPVHSAAAALVAVWFYESWIARGMGRLESLREATRRLREAGRPECEAALGRRIYLPGERPFEDEYYWGAFVLYGAW